MDITGALKSRIDTFKKRFYLIKSPKRIKESIHNWEISLENSREYYLDAYRFFKKCLPATIVQHKEYFRQNKRGFGEDAFHTMWYLLYEKYMFSNFLEIGVYRGQVMSLVTYLAKLKKETMSVIGISPFNKSGDSVSNYTDIDYIEDIYKNFERFSLDKPKLISAYSTDAKAVNAISSVIWDCIYIDGSHDYEVVKQDWENCSKNVKIGGIIVIDDASLYTNYKNPFFAFKGHAGPSQVANEIDQNEFKEVLRVGHNRVFERLK